MGLMTETRAADGFALRGGPDDRLLAWPRVKEITGLSRTTAWRMQKAHDFPVPVQVSRGRVGWWQSDLDRWKASRESRPAAETKPFANRSAGDAPRRAEAAGSAADAPTGTLERAARPAAPCPDKRRRKTSPDQIAFDFGL